MINFNLQFVASTIGVIIAGLLFWKIIKKTIHQKVELKWLEKDIHELTEATETKNDLKIGEVIEWHELSYRGINGIMECCEGLGIYIGKDKYGNMQYIDKFGNITVKSYLTHSPHRKYNIKINFEEIPTEEEKIAKRVRVLEELNELNNPNPKNKNSEINQNETNKI